MSDAPAVILKEMLVAQDGVFMLAQEVNGSTGQDAAQMHDSVVVRSLGKMLKNLVECGWSEWKTTTAPKQRNGIQVAKPITGIQDQRNQLLVLRPAFVEVPRSRSPHPSVLIQQVRFEYLRFKHAPFLGG